MSDVSQIKSVWGFLAYLFKYHFKKVVITLIILALCILAITVGFSVDTKFGTVEKKPIDIEQIKR